MSDVQCYVAIVMGTVTKCEK